MSKFTSNEILFLISTLEVLASINTSEIEIMLAKRHITRLGVRLLNRSNTMAINYRFETTFKASTEEKLSLLIMKEKGHLNGHQGIELNLLNKLINPEFYAKKNKQKKTTRQGLKRIF